MQSHPPSMTPLKPHMLRACFDCLLENGLTPYLTVNPKFGNPDDWLLPEFLRSQKAEKFTFDCSPDSVDDFFITPQSVGFEASFSGEVYEILIPMEAVVRLHAKENGEGVDFDEGPQRRALLPLAWKSSQPRKPASWVSQAFKLL